MRRHEEFMGMQRASLLEYYKDLLVYHTYIFECLLLIFL